MAHGFPTGEVLAGVSRGLDKPPLGLPRKEAREDRAFALDQRQRLQVQQDIAAEFSEFEREYKKALGSFITSNGLVHQPLTGVFNKTFAGEGAIELIRDPTTKTFTFRTTGPSGKVSEKKGLSFDEVGNMAVGALDPESFFDAKAKEKGVKLSPGDVLVGEQSGKRIAQGLPKADTDKKSLKTVKAGETVIDQKGKIIFQIPSKIEGQKVSPFNPQSYEAQIGREVARNMGGQLLPGGGWLIPEGQNERFEVLNEMAQLIGRQTGGKIPAGTLAGIISRNGREIISEDQAKQQARIEAENKARLFASDAKDFPDDRGSRENFITRRVGEIVQESIIAAIERANIEIPQALSALPEQRPGAQGLPGADPQPTVVEGQPVAQPQAAATQAQGTEQSPFTPKTDADFAAIPPGAIFLDPQDGKLYRKE